MGRQKSSAAPSLHNENQEGLSHLETAPFRIPKFDCYLATGSITAANIFARTYAGIHPANLIPLLQRIAGAAVVGEPAIDLVHPAGLAANIELIQIRNSFDIGTVVNRRPT